MIMIIFLIVVAVFFIEYRFVITPGIERYDALMQERQQVEDQVNTIELNLAIAKNNKQKTDDNLDEIKALAKRYFGELQMDALLVHTHDLLLQEEFSPSQYQMQQVISSSLSPTTAVEFDLSYQLKELANTYKALSEEKNESNEQNDNQDETQAVASDQVEQYQIAINARTTYDQVHAFLDAIADLQRSVVIESLSMVPDLNVNEPEEPEEPEGQEDQEQIQEPVQPAEQMLDVHLTLNYYGLAQLIPKEDSFNQWYRDDFEPVTYTPFKQPPVPTEETQPTETANGEE